MVWVMMSTMWQVDEEGLISWANGKVAGQAPSMAGFQDKSLSDSKFLLHMLEGVRPETVDWEEVQEGADDDQTHSNASYLIAIARKMVRCRPLTLERPEASMETSMHTREGGVRNYTFARGSCPALA